MFILFFIKYIWLKRSLFGDMELFFKYVKIKEKYIFNVRNWNRCVWLKYNLKLEGKNFGSIRLLKLFEEGNRMDKK